MKSEPAETKPAQLKTQDQHILVNSRKGLDFYISKIFQG